MAPKYDIDPNRKYTIAIVGGGIGGLATAIGLLHQGISVEIYEAAHKFGEIGAGVAFGPNAARAMQLIDPAIYEGYLKVRTGNAFANKQHVWFSFRRGDKRLTDGDDSPAGTHLFDAPCETGPGSTHRAHFLDQLIALVPPGIAHFGKRLTRTEPAASSDGGDGGGGGGGVVLHFDDGSTATHEAVIGCDGVKSHTRAAVARGHDPTFSGKYAYRGLIPMDDAVALLGDELARNSQFYVAHGGHILTFPIDNGAMMNVVAFGTKEDGLWEDPQWVKEVNRKDMEKDFAGWIEPAQQIIGMMQKADVWALFDLPPLPTFYTGRVCLLGDAAHATTPHNGAGAGQAIEDALIMSQAMKLVYDSKDIVRAFAAYDQVRRARSQQLVLSSREAGLIYDLQGPGIGDDLDKLQQKLLDNKDWLWKHEFDGDIKEVERLFHDGA